MWLRFTKEFVLMTALPTAQPAYGLEGPSADRTVDNATPQGSTYRRGNSVQPNGASSPVEEDTIRSRACFNGQGGASRNLERYLNLIVKLSKQDKRESYQFYVRMKNKLLEGMSLDRIFEEEDFEFSRGDFSRYQLWKVIVNSTDELLPNTASQVVSHLMEHLPEYSLLDMENVAAGSRTSLTYSLLKLLDQAAWGADQSARRNNTPENISEIADWVFGERSHSGAGVLSTLAKPDRGPLGLFDLMLFRLYCSADRGGSLFNLQRALSLHGDPGAPTEGNTTMIAKEEMREISQKVFQIFKNQYIAPEKNIFEAIDNLSLRDLAGKCSDFVSAQIESKKVTKDQVEQLIAAEKSRVKTFVVYQLGNSMISSGVGCGLYDETGKNDQKGIARQVNNYLFGLCFNPNVSLENFERFVDYLLMLFEHTFGLDDGVRYVPSVAVFTKVLEEERLKEYWMTHKAAIQALSLRAKKKDVRTFNYVATYEDDLDAVYRVLDQLVG
ncbi:MAG: hypothetical protein NTW45_10090 [Rhodocyclales bacterium]|nr:hypothetical protein [Rhodocyclales bacterium]